jgi:hypothetical protein
MTNPLGVEIKVKIPDDFFDFLELNEADISDMKKKMADEAADFWKSHAAIVLKASSADHYIEAITVEDSSDGYKVVLGNAGQKPQLAVAIEVGGDGFDMKPGFLGKVDTPTRTMPLWRGTPDHPEEPRKVSWTHPGWIHPGFGQGKGLRTIVEDYIEDTLVKEAVDEWWDRLD